MSVVSTLYGPANQSITITLNSLAGSGNQQQSTAISNTGTVYLDAQVQFSVVTTNGAVSTGAVKCYSYATAGSSYGDTVTGTNGTVTLTAPPNLRLLSVLNCPSGSTVYTSDPVSVAAVYGGMLPPSWGIVIENDTGAAFGSSTSNLAWFQGVQQSVI